MNRVKQPSRNHVALRAACYWLHSVDPNPLHQESDIAQSFLNVKVFDNKIDDADIVAWATQILDGVTKMLSLLTMRRSLYGEDRHLEIGEGHHYKRRLTQIIERTQARLDSESSA